MVFVCALINVSNTLLTSMNQVVFSENFVRCLMDVNKFRNVTGCAKGRKSAESHEIQKRSCVDDAKPTPTHTPVGSDESLIAFWHCLTFFSARPIENALRMASIRREIQFSLPMQPDRKFIARLLLKITNQKISEGF